jgi:hypothetical protein
LGKFFIVYASCLTKNGAFALALLFEGKIGSSEIFFAFLRKFFAIAKINIKTHSLIIGILVLTYGVSFEELHGALEEVGEHPLVHDGPGPRS